jgi:hypothetical protein
MSLRHLAQAAGLKNRQRILKRLRLIIVRPAGGTVATCNPEQYMVKQIVPPVASGLGLLLLILSFVWPSITDPTAGWTAEQAQERGDAVAELHKQTYAPASDQALKNAKDRMRQSDVAFQDALNQRSRFVAILKWSGIALVAIGAITLVVSKNSAGK